MNGGEAQAVVIQADGKIVAAGHAFGGSNTDFVVTRYDPDGSLDTTFDADGSIFTDFAGFDEARAVALQADGKIVVAGRGAAPTLGSPNAAFALARYHTNGSLDTTFDSDGKVLTGFGGTAEAFGVVLQADGKIVASGRGAVVDPSSGASVSGFALARYNADGSLDTTFDGDGTKITDLLTGAEVAFDIVLQGDGKAVLAGSSNADFPGAAFALARYNTDGSLDTSFDGDGFVTSDLRAGDEYALSLALQADGKLVAAGTSRDSSAGNSADFALARYASDGSLDASFDGDGKVFTDLGLSDDRASGVVVQSDQRIVAAGYGGNFEFALSRYNPNGTLDVSFDGDGKVTTDFEGNVDAANDVAIQPDGKLVAAGTAGFQAFALARYEVTLDDGELHPLPPARILDTRNGTGGIFGKVGQSQTVNVPVLGRGGVPAAGVSAVIMNVTVTEPTASSYLTVYPSGTPRPVASNLNYLRGQTVPNLVKAKVGTGGAVSAFNLAGATHVIFDVVGWYSNASGPAGARFHSLPPTRIADTRGEPEGPLGPDEIGYLEVVNGAGVPPEGVSAVVMNVTVTEPSAASYLTVFPGDEDVPLASNLNFVPGQTVPNLVVAKVGVDGDVGFYNRHGFVHVVVDIVGWYSEPSSEEGSQYRALAPTRILDTRNGTGGVFGKVGHRGTIQVPVTSVGGVPASGVSAVVMNVTVTEPTSPSYLTVYPSGASRPLASNLNYVAHQTVPNLVVAKVGANGRVTAFNFAGATHVIFDVVGWFQEGGGAAVTSAASTAGPTAGPRGLGLRR